MKEKTEAINILDAAIKELVSLEEGANDIVDFIEVTAESAIKESTEKQKTAEDAYWASKRISSMIKKIYKKVTGKVLKPGKKLFDKSGCLVCGEDIYYSSHTRKYDLLRMYKNLSSASDTNMNIAYYSSYLVCGDICNDIYIEYRRNKLNVFWRSTGSRMLELSTMKYNEYLYTDEWKEKRDLILEIKGNNCALCRSYTNIHVHHNSYTHRGYEFLDELLPLCAKCHKKHHGK